MWLRKIAALARRAAIGLSKTHSVAMLLILVMAFYTTLGVVLRYVFSQPLRGSTDVQLVGMAILIGMSLAYRGLHGGHISIDLLFRNLSPRAKAIMGSITSLVSTSFVLTLAWYGFSYTQLTFDTWKVTTILKFPVFIPVAIITLGFVALALVFLSDFLDHLSKAVKK